MRKNCYNCLHKEKRGKEVPCNSCENVNGTPTNWQPETYENGLLPCPFCGGTAEMHGGPEEWNPTFYDPDSGGDPYCVCCKCGVHFETGSYDAEEVITAWNRRVAK